MSKNKGKKPKNSTTKKSSQNSTMAQLFDDFRGSSNEDFSQDFYDEDTERREKFLEVYELSCGNVSASCRASGIPRRTYYNWLNSNSAPNVEFRRRLEEIKPGERLFDMAELVVWHHLNMGDLNAAKFVLTKNKHAYSRGYQDKPSDIESPIEKEYQQLRRFIQKMARENGVDYLAELRDFINEFEGVVEKEILGRLKRELES
jgi:hypothetical protein